MTSVTLRRNVSETRTPLIYMGLGKTMHDILTKTIQAVMEEISTSYFPPDFHVVPRATINVGDGDTYEATGGAFPVCR